MTYRAAAIIIWGAVIVLLFIGLFAPPIRNSIPSNMAASGWLSGGLFSMGVLSAGLFSIGIFSAGLFSVGVFSVGVFSVGIFSFGTFAVGVWAVGQFFIPWLKMKDKDTKQ